MKILVAPSESVGWDYIDNYRKPGEAPKIHIVFDKNTGVARCHRGSYYMDIPREMFVKDFFLHDARCLLCCREIVKDD